NDLLFIIREIHRLLKPGGVYILTTPAPWADFVLRLFAKIRLVSPVEIVEHKAAYSQRKIKEILHASNFSKDGVTAGYFEFYMNNWVKAKKL
ncbi:MAG: hypothetical protein M0018_09015, partial [Nitrospiraceae bacterium]|nr:hypothetical protein [Nitrospiraceae bacterium]